MNNLMHRVWRAAERRAKRGATALEYALMVVLIVVGLVVIFKRLSTGVLTETSKAAGTITSTISGMGTGGT